MLRIRPDLSSRNTSNRAAARIFARDRGVKGPPGRASRSGVRKTYRHGDERIIHAPTDQKATCSTCLLTGPS